MTPISREDAIKKLSEHESNGELIDILKTETHDYPLVLSDSGRLFWKADPLINELFNRCWISLNRIASGECNKELLTLGSIRSKAEFPQPNNIKNDEVFRALYRRLGYSLYGYWEIFYWEANNSRADEYTFTQMNLDVY